ncbi:uncharacterized protein [Ptychodera flava]|uniref:uncharacterized protein n=1 Tax=Ptychodera flava TaxID=63121 RepID=UPI003969D218
MYLYNCINKVSKKDKVRNRRSGDEERYLSTDSGIGENDSLDSPFPAPTDDPTNTKECSYNTKSAPVHHTRQEPTFDLTVTEETHKLETNTIQQSPESGSSGTLDCIQQKVTQKERESNIHQIPSDNQDKQGIDKIIKCFDNFAGHCELGHVYKEHDFIGSVFGNRGGYLMMPPGDIVLYIPPDAIEEGQRQPVYFYVDSDKCSQSDSDMVVMTPVVTCGPTGVKFKKEVILALPHYAASANSWKFTAVTKQSGSEWKTLDSAVILVKEETMFLLLMEFAKFRAIEKGVAAAFSKRMKMSEVRSRHLHIYSMKHSNNRVKKDIQFVRQNDSSQIQAALILMKRKRQAVCLEKMTTWYLENK